MKRLERNGGKPQQQQELRSCIKKRAQIKNGQRDKDKDKDTDKDKDNLLEWVRRERDAGCDVAVQHIDTFLRSGTSW